VPPEPRLAPSDRAAGPAVVDAAAPPAAALAAEPAEPAGPAAAPVAPADGDRPLPTNGDLAAIFHEIGDLLEIKGELVFKTVAYHRAADAIAHSPHEIARAYRAGKPPVIPGVGKAINDKIAEIVGTGGLRFLDRVRAEVPPSLTEILAIPGVGPKTVRLIWDRFGITDLAGLAAALSDGAVEPGKGFSAKTIEGLRVAVDAMSRRTARMTLGQAETIVDALVELLGDAPGLRSITPAGSFRRRRETIGDIDLLAETDDPAALVERFTTLPPVEAVLGAGTHKAAVRLVRGPQVDLMIMPSGTAGTYLVHFTGSKEHNVKLRGRARDRGWSLSEKGFARLGEGGEPATGDAAELRTFATEGEAYRFLDLDFIEPELREDRGEVEAAAAGTLPRLVAEADLRGDCHAHSNWSDGVHTVEAMAEAARARGYAYLVLSDHSQSLGVANGLTPARVMAQRGIVAALNERFAREEDAGRAPATGSLEGFRILHGCELEIRADGRLDYEDDFLALYDVVVAAVHVARRQSRDQLTARVLGAIANPHVDVIAHPAGRMLGDRERPDLDLAWDEIYGAAAANGTLLEIDGSDHRLDLAPERARRAVELGCRLTIDSDAHRTDELAGIRWGVAQARRAWVEPRVVANTWSRAALLAWCAGKAERIA
jgi:DNA polymerase (family X)